MSIDGTTIRGFLLAGGGITISEIELWEGWISLAIKMLAFIVMVITLFIYWNKYQNQKNSTMRPDNDNESGRGGDLEPREDEGEDEQ